MSANRLMLAISTLTIAILPTQPGCGQETDYVIEVTPYEDGSFVATLPDGDVYYHREAYERDLPKIAAKMSEEGRVIRVDFVGQKKQSSSSLAADSPYGSSQIDGPQEARPIYLPWGYVLTAGDLEKGEFVRGCIWQKTDWKYPIRLHKDGRQLFDLHFAGYTKNGTSCWGVYESEKKRINFCFCLPFSYDQLRESVRSAIYQASNDAGTNPYVAAMVAALITPLVVGVLVF